MGRISISMSKGKKKNISPIRLITLILIIVGIGYLFLRLSSSVRAMQWWPNGGASWKMRKQLTVTNNSAANLSSGATIAITVDTKALYDTGKLQSDCDDLRVLYQ